MVFEQPLLGVLQLQNRPLDLPGSMGDPGSYAGPVRFIQVPGAWTHAVVGEGDEVLDAYVECAQELVAQGCTAITTNCGFSARFQRQVAEAVSVPVALSSLLLVPWAAAILPPAARVAVVTYDAEVLTDAHFEGAGWTRAETPVEVVGIEGTESWQRLAEPDAPVTREMIVRDVLAVSRNAVEEHPEIHSIVLECSAFAVAADCVRRACGLPTMDFLTLANTLVRSAPPRSAKHGTQVPRNDASETSLPTSPERT